MSDELGLPGLAIAEEHGGSGYGIVELAVVLEEIGRADLPFPFLPTVLAAAAVEAAGPVRRRPRPPPLARGRTPGGRRDVCATGTPAWTLEDGHVRGVLPHVPDGATADHLVLVAPGAPVRSSTCTGRGWPAPGWRRWT